MKYRKGQGSPQSYISLLIFVIGLSMIIYILMLPPADRAELLEQNRTKPGDGIKDSITVLKTEEPGTLSNLPETEIIKDLPGFTLFSRTDAAILSEFETIYVKKSLFEEQSRNISFTIDNFDNTGNFVLSFTVPRHSGMLTIILNGQILTTEEHTTASPPPMRLPKDYLQRQNTLVFKVSGPGVEFWKSNEYLIRNMKITAEVTDNSGIENKIIFVVTEQEKTNLESFQLSFVADCKATDVSPIQIYLNKRLIYSSIPDCGFPVKVPPQDKTRIKEGENDILFRAEKGFYELYSVETKMKLSKPLFPTYYFYLDDTTYNKIQEGKADINVSLLFPNSLDRKKGVVLVNDYMSEIETYDAGFSRTVNTYVRKGNNAVEIRPKSEKLDVVELSIILAE